MKDTVRLIAALGSSFAAGPGIEPVADKGAMRSAGNYAHLLADRLGAKLVDLTVSGASTATILSETQRMATRRFPPQLDGLPQDADLVTITAGGNDLKLAGSMLAAAVANRARKQFITRPIVGRLSRATPLYGDADIAAAAAGLASIVTAVNVRAPRARVMLVDYLTIIGPSTHTSDDVPLSDEQIALFARVQSALQSAFVTAAADSGAELVRASQLSHDHGLGSAEPWVFPYRGLRNLSSVFHPNATGMRAIADDIYSRVTDA